MFTRAKKRGTFWFNLKSLESQGEFELIGTILYVRDARKAEKREG
jgi:hypothetical protein